MRLSLIVAAAISGVSAFPSVVNQVDSDFDLFHANGGPVEKRANPAFEFSKTETNCGPVKCNSFNAKEQFRTVSGKHAFQSPAITDIRGPCPGLNAAANHGYIPRDGLMGFKSTIFGLSYIYGLSKEFNAFLVAYSIVQTGDLVSMKWSIGGPQPYNNLGGALYPPQGISYSHNKYEGDVSIARPDAYTNNGDAHSLNMTRFLRAFELGIEDNRYTLHKFRKGFTKNVQYSIKENPYFFSPPFSTAAVSPAAYYFVINFMSNHSAEEPSGYLDAYNFKHFFAIKGNYPNFRWAKGQERIPENWYRRPLLNPYGAATTVEDVAVGWAGFPASFKIGGNTNGVNTYQGVELADLTGGTFTNANILEGNNAGCFIFLAAQEGLPDELKGGVNDVAAATKFLNKFTSPITSKLGCPQLGKYDTSVFEPFPGRNYNPTGEATNY